VRFGEYENPYVAFYHAYLKAKDGMKLKPKYIEECKSKQDQIVPERQEKRDDFR